MRTNRSFATALETSLRLQQCDRNQRHFARSWPLKKGDSKFFSRRNSCDLERLQATSQKAANAWNPESFPFDEPLSEEMQMRKRKAQILMEIATSGDRLQEVINKHAAEIDQQLIDILNERAKAARRTNESENAVVGLLLLKKKLEAEMEYRKASPSLQLLNELMNLMPPMKELVDEEFDQDIEDILREAFRPSEAPHVDIFDTAARVARGEEVDPIVPEDQGHIPKQVFVREVEQFLVKAAKTVKVLGKTISKQRKMGKLDAAQENAFNMRSIALDQIDRILEIAKKI